jgi:amidase
MTSNDDWAYRSATDTVAALARREISSRELVDSAIGRIEAQDGRINAVVVRDFERARAAADRADQALAAGERLPLLGLPVTVKESIDVAGLPKTWGNPAFREFRPEADALAVARLKAAGAILLGKTNVPFMLVDWQTFNDIYGTTNNPHDIRRAPGGSSGGSAAALAAGFVPLELGSDFFGSMRNPAHCCGVFAHRPTLDVVPMRGVGVPGVPAGPSTGGFAVLGPMARSARDLALAFGVLAGPDPRAEGLAYRLALPPPRHQALRSFRILLLQDHPLCPTSAEVRAVLDELAVQLEGAGCALSRQSPLLPDLGKINALFLTVVSAVSSAGRPLEEQRQMIAARDALAADDETLTAAFLRGCGISYRDWTLLLRTRQALSGTLRELFQSFDVLICPVAPTPAIPHDHGGMDRTIEVDGARTSYWAQGSWNTIASLLGFPATVAPIGRSRRSGLPIGAQIVGPYLEDQTPLTFAALLEQERGGLFQPPAPLSQQGG